MSAARLNVSPLCLKRKRPPIIEIPTVLQEIEPLILQHPTPRADAVSSDGNDYVGVFSVKGKKRFMEDFHKIIPCSNEAFFGVYDGHGGRKAAKFVAENLHNNILEMTVNCTTSAEKQEAIKAAFLKTDRDFLTLGLGSGVCCLTALIQGQQLVVSNLGDCRAVLSRGGVAEAVTKDHRVEHEDERSRIENKGGYVEIHKGAWRVHGVLSVSRSIGDSHLKEWVLAEPDSKVFNLSEDLEFLVLASDGLWEKVSNQEAINVVTQLCAKDIKFRPLKGCLRGSDCGLGSVNISASSELRRVSLGKQQKGVSQSPSYKKAINCWDCGEDDGYGCENESPKSKSRRLPMKIKTESPTKENSGSYRKRPTSTSSRLVAACKELVHLALSRGSWDDITVMIIDLSRFRFKAM